MSDLIESLGVIRDTDRLFEATLHRNGEISLNLEDAEGAVEIRYNLDEIRTIVATLGHLLWLSDNHDED